ncbi:endonuclease/exonuclease/phosphatase family protein [Streptomyces cylindrosporus]|uniref:Endonuclease/exonuclease/phosphatase family protein n=1 Tax=Streptomyces cylindrosporus TaxID=2927583 RepID=A0ABS9XXX1_9ACTN|nr:endonuclease/exonuclease/phosphatase family protein [Streptomyces cylindrosporus]MCI3269809.1 endonuclease/exonuclease/phosphatase family protein [Streptomyces cylindrosporus]
MTIRIATFNTENLFRRPKAFELENDADRQEVLNDYAELVSLLEQPVYQEADKERIAELVVKYRAYDSDPQNPPLIYVNQTRGGSAQLFRKTGDKDSPTIEVTAKGRGKWSGWAELTRTELDWTVVRNTGRVVAEVNADVLLTVEVEDRLALARFNEQVLGGALGKQPYPYTMLIDGNDPRGIDVGILSRHPIRSIRSHLSELRSKGHPLFSRDCPEYEIALDGTSLWVLGNHLKSKRGGGASLRLAQARRVAEIYGEALDRSPYVVVAGDLNDSPDSEPVEQLLATGARDVMSPPVYTGDPGTYGTGHSLNQKIDYLLCSPELLGLVRHVDVERRGVWAPRTFKSFDTVTSKATEASDHAALYADVDL